jgi:hypothetical protein
LESLKNITKIQQRDKPGYFEDPEKDRLVALILELTEDICVLNDRLDSCELLAWELVVHDPDGIRIHVVQRPDGPYD